MNRSRIWLFSMLGALFLLVCLLTCGSSPQLSVNWTSAADSGQDSTRTRLNVYFENSGSMKGYLHAGSQFKNAVYNYLRALDLYTDTVELNYINVSTVSIPSPLSELVSYLTPQRFNGRTSDMAEMLDMILGRADDRTVSIFISDCILDLPQGQAGDFFHIQQTDIRSAFARHLQRRPDLAVEVFRLESTFRGPYFSTSGTVHLSDVSRPYYLWVVGPCGRIAELNRAVSPYRELTHGVRNALILGPKQSVPFSITDRFGAGRANSCLCKADRNGSFELRIKADLSGVIQEEAYLAEPDNYRCLPADGGLTVKAIERLPSGGRGGYTHRFLVSVASWVPSGQAGIQLSVPPFPEWIDAVNDDTGRDIAGNLEKTTGIKYLLQGVADAYATVKNQAEISFDINRY